jgi:hypothetical protein
VGKGGKGQGFVAIIGMQDQGFVHGLFLHLFGLGSPWIWDLRLGVFVLYSFCGLGDWRSIAFILLEIAGDRQNFFFPSFHFLFLDLV